MFYPKILIALTAIISVFILTFLMPSYVSTFVRSGVELPWTTRMLVTLWNSFQAFWLLILPIFITVGIVILRAWRHLKRHPQVDRLLLLLPYFGPLRTARMLALLCRTLAMLLSSGVTLDLALFNTQRLPTSPLWRDALQQARRRLREGRLLSEAIAESGCFPNQLVQMLHVGESGGELPQLLRQAASFYQQRAALQAEHLGQLMQPIAMLGAALFIGGLSVALISPLYAQLDLIQNVAKIY